jgi:hypothetical protein
MSHTAVTSTQVAERAPKSRRGGPSRLQTVGDYSGQPAGEAAQAVRRAGLKPGLERSFGFAPELRGQIVAQVPAAGGELARNGLVTLYVAAPGSGQSGEQDAAVSRAGEQPEGEASVGRRARAEPASDGAGAAPRRRKPGRSPGARGPAFDALSPRRPAGAQATKSIAGPESDDERAWSATDRAPLDAQHGETERDLASEEYVVNADELFVGRASANAPAWRQAYLRRRRGVRARLAEHRRLSVAALVLLLSVWLVVAGATALNGRRASPPRPITASRGNAEIPADEDGRTMAATRPRPRRKPTLDQHAARRRQRPIAELKPARRPSPLRAPVQTTHADGEPVAPRPAATAAANREFGPAQREVKRLLRAPQASPTNERRRGQ